MSEPTKILTAAEVEVLALYHPVNAGSTHYENCWKEHPRCALRMVAASHLALWRENAERSEARNKKRHGK